MKQRWIALCMASALGLSLTACGQKVDAGETLAQQLFEAKNAYVGDASSDMEILSLLKAEEDVGAYQLEIQSDSQPYGITIVSEASVPDNINSLQKKAWIFMALVDNCGYVQWEFADDHIVSATPETAITLEKNLKQDYSDSVEAVQALLEELDGKA